MEKKAVSGIMLALLLISISSLTFNIQPVKASGTIHIRADGSIDPPDSPISSVDNITYTFDDNIFDQIVVERSNITIDGNGYTLQGSGTHASGYGFYMNGICDVTIKNTNIKDFGLGIYLISSSNNNMSGNSITTSYDDGIYLSSSSNNSVSENNITDDGLRMNLTIGRKNNSP